MTRISDVSYLHPQLQRQLRAVLDETMRLGLPLQVYETIRSPARQEQLYRRGRDPEAADFGRFATKAQAYQSAHQYGLAVDLVFFIDGRWSWDPPKGRANAWHEMHDVARDHGLTPLATERPHLQIKAFDPDLLDRGPSDTAGWLAWVVARHAKAG